MTVGGPGVMAESRLLVCWRFSHILNQFQDDSGGGRWCGLRSEVRCDGHSGLLVEAAEEREIRTDYYDFDVVEKVDPDCSGDGVGGAGLEFAEDGVGYTGFEYDGRR